MPQQKQRILLGVLLAVLCLFLLQIAWPFAASLVLASILAIVLHPVNTRLSSRLQPGPASLLTTLATLLALVTALAFLGVTAVKTAKNGYGALNQRSLEQTGEPGTVFHTTDQIVDAVAKRLPVPREAIRAKVLAGMEAGVRYFLSQAQGVIQGMTSLLVTSFLSILFLYYLLRYGEGWLHRVVALVPLSPEITANLLRVARQSIVANVNGVLVVALAQGLFLGLGFRFVGIGSPMQWGVFGAMASVIPFVGASLIWVPAVIGLVVMGSYWKALMLGLWGGLVVGSLDNILRPLVVGAREKQNPVLVGFAMLGGTYAIGPLGLLCGPLAVSLAGAVVDELHRMRPISNDREVVPREPSRAESSGQTVTANR